MNAKRDYRGVDLFRIAAAFLVVAIHTSPLATYSETADFILTREIARVAVPFFFMTTGFFVLGSRGRTRSFLKKTALLYAAALLLYLPVNVYAGHLDGLTLPELFTQLVFEGTFYHLWYLPAAVLGTALASLLLEKLAIRPALAIAAALYLVGLMGDSYYGLVSGLPVLGAAYDALISVCGHTRNGLFFAPVFLLLGCLLRKNRPGRAASTAGFALSALLLIAEGMLLRHLRLQLHDSMYISLPAVMYFLFSLLSGIRGRRPAWAADFSMLVYLLHPAMIIAVRGAARPLGLWGILVENSLGHYLAVCAASALASAALLPLLDRLRPVRASRRSRAWLELDGAALRHNYRALSSLLPPGGRLMCVLKSDAYGLGAEGAVAALSAEGASLWAVATAEEGKLLRKYGARGTILVLGRTPVSDIGLLRRFRLTQTVVSLEYARELSAARRRLEVQIKLDTGMHRLGISWQDLDSIDAVFSLPFLRVTGIYTHLAASESLSPRDADFTREQSERFFAVANALRQRGRDVGMLHTQSSYGLLNYPDMRCDCARPGIALCGVRSSAGDSTAQWPALRPVLSLRARISEVREVPAGEGVGYDLAFVTGRTTRLAAVPIGYADGIFRSAGGACGLVNGLAAPVAGRICMDQLLLDVTGCGEVHPGDTVTFIGRDGAGEISAEELAARCGTITNELLSRLGRRLPRIWVSEEDGE